MSQTTHDRGNMYDYLVACAVDTRRTCSPSRLEMSTVQHHPAGTARPPVHAPCPRLNQFAIAVAGTVLLAAAGEARR